MKNFILVIIFLYTFIWTNAQNTTFKKFDKKKFDSTIYVIRDSALKTLKKAYPQISLIRIEITGLSRTLEEQKNNFKNGSSTTLFSAHNLGAAADFTIYFDGTLVNPNKEKAEKSIYYSFTPYQILGKFILDHGYFWGLTWDPAHCQLMRKTFDIIKYYPEFQENNIVIAFYNEMNKSDTIPIKYKPFIEIMDTKFNKKEKRNYDEKQPWVEESLLTPIKP